MTADAAILEARIFGLPVAQPRARARAFQVGGSTRVSLYDPPQAKDWKRTVFAQVLPHKPPEVVEGPLTMTLAFILPRPPSLPRREQFPTRRPDLDNLTKAIKDALRGVVYRDDSQIVQLALTKAYGPAPGVLIRIERAIAPARQPDLVPPVEPVIRP